MECDMSNDAASNKLLNLIQAEFPDYHPLLSLARIAHKTLENVGIDEETQAPNEEVATLKLQAECHQTIAKYTEAQLRSVELKANVKTDFGHLRVSLSKPIPLDDPSVINGVAEEVGILDEPGDSND